MWEIGLYACAGVILLEISWDMVQDKLMIVVILNTSLTGSALLSLGESSCRSLVAKRNLLVTATWRLAFPSSIISMTSSGLDTNLSLAPWNKIDPLKFSSYGMFDIPAKCSQVKCRRLSLLHYPDLQKCSDYFQTLVPWISNNVLRISKKCRVWEQKCSDNFQTLPKCVKLTESNKPTSKGTHLLVRTIFIFLPQWNWI